MAALQNGSSRLVVQTSKKDLLERAEASLHSRRTSVVGVSAKLRVTTMLARLSRAARRSSERPSEADDPSGSARSGDSVEASVEASLAQARAAGAGGDAADGGEAYEEFELPLRGLPLHLLGSDAASAAARREAGLPEAPLAVPSAASSAVDGTNATLTNGSGADGNLVTGNAIGNGGAVAIGAVHAKMCEYALVGRLPLQEEKPDVASAGHHLICAAAANDLRALRDLRSLSNGLPGSEALVGVKLRDDDVPVLAAWLPIITHRLASAGDIGSMIEMGSRADDPNGELAGGAFQTLSVTPAPLPERITPCSPSHPCLLRAIARCSPCMSPHRHRH